jgi:hypothetical protein
VLHHVAVTQYFNASVNKHTVVYDDSDIEHLVLSKETYQLLEQPNKPAAGASAGHDSAQQDTNSSGSSSIDAAAFMQQQDFGVLLDCTPTLALYHPDPIRTRRPHTWHYWSERLLLDVQRNPEKKKGERYNLLEALGLVKPNSALFMRKVAAMDRVIGCDTAALLRTSLKLLWKDKPLPDTLPELEAFATKS